MSKPVYTLAAQNRLKSKKLFEEIFASGKSLRTADLMLVYKIVTLPVGISSQAAFSVPKRRFKKAVDRNYLKRLMREAYRHQRPGMENLIKIKNFQVALVFVFTGHQSTHFERVSQKISLLLQQLLSELNSK